MISVITRAGSVTLNGCCKSRTGSWVTVLAVTVARWKGETEKEREKGGGGSFTKWPPFPHLCLSSLISLRIRVCPLL